MRVVEIFKSLQGEGRAQGQVATFLRLAGCNLNCAWCDTQYARSAGAGTEMSTKEIVRQITTLGCRRICITGGEPLVQKENLIPLLEYLAVEHYEISIETNGTIEFKELLSYATVCMDVKCPSSGEISDLNLLANLREEDVVKFVISNGEDILYAEKILHDHWIDALIIFSPAEGSDMRMIADTVLERDLPVTVQIQLHKVLGVR